MYMPPIHQCEGANPWLGRAAIEVAKLPNVVEVYVTPRALVVNGTWDPKSQDKMQAKILRYGLARERGTSNNRPPTHIGFTFLGKTEKNEFDPKFYDGIFVAYIENRSDALAEVAPLFHP